MVNSVMYGGMKTIDYSAQSRLDSLPPGTGASSGQLCPQTGVWKCERYQVVVGVSRGSVMPQYQNRDVDWTLTEYSLTDLEQAQSR